MARELFQRVEMGKVECDRVVRSPVESDAFIL